jgi:hypothetical protein
MQPFKIKGYEVHESLNPSDYDITKDGRTIAHLREESNCYSIYVIDAGGSIIYDKQQKNSQEFKTLLFLNKVVDDIEDYYERKRCFI